MREAVREAFVPFTIPLEGVVPFLYLDVKSYVTIAIGILCDPIETALDLPMVHPGGEPATREEIAAEWRMIKSHPELAAYGHRAAAQYCRLHLTPEGVQQVVLAKLDVFDRELKKRFPEWEEWPADAQLATLSMAWACGAWFKFGNLEKACKAQDWDAAAASCKINEDGNPGIIPRNKLNVQLYRNAAWIDSRNLDRDTLMWTPNGPEAA
jgi:GH24 family phage-related lysozyme (muramidase)